MTTDARKDGTLHFLSPNGVKNKYQQIFFYMPFWLSDYFYGSVIMQEFWSPLISARIAIDREHSCLNADWSRAYPATASPREMPRMHQLPALGLGTVHF